jgi:polysaccharide biosynthesis transport protein
VRLLRKYWVWVLICTIACVAGAWIVGAISPVRYTSTASVDVEASPISGSQPATVNTSTEKEVASSGVVLGKAAPLTGLSTDQLSSHISIAVPSGANVLSISCTMPNPAAARRCATAVSQAYMNFRNDVYTPKAAARDPLTVTLVSAAQLPTKPSGLRLRVLLPLGALIGVLLGFGTAYLRDRADDRVRDRDDLEDCLGEPVLAVVPRSRSAAEAARVFATEPGSAAAEAYRYLRAHVEPLIPADGNGGKVLLVTGAQRQEGRSSVACNLATALAQAGRRVLLVDADLRHPFLADVFETGSRPGLTELLAGEATLADVAAPTGRHNLQLVTAGKQAGEPSDVLNSDSLAHAIGAMRAAADVIVVDSGPAVSVSDPVTIAQLSDLVLQVANVRRTPRAAIRAAAQELRTSGAVRLAGVLTGVPGKLTIHRPQVRPAQQPEPEAARATAVRQTAVQQTTVPQTTVPQTTVPQTTAQRDLITRDAGASVASATRH